MPSIHLSPIAQSAVINFTSDEQRKTAIAKLREVIIKKAHPNDSVEKINSLVVIKENDKSAIISLTWQGIDERVSLDNIIRMFRDGEDAVNHRYTLRHEAPIVFYDVDLTAIAGLVALTIHPIPNYKVTVDLNRSRLPPKHHYLCQAFENFLIATITATDKYKINLPDFEIEGLSSEADNIIRQTRYAQLQALQKVKILELNNAELCRTHEQDQHEIHQLTEELIKLRTENAQLTRKNTELEMNAIELSKEHHRLHNELDDVKTELMRVAPEKTPTSLRLFSGKQ